MMKNITGFFTFLETVYGIDFHDWDENYAGKEKKEIEDDYEYYCNHPEEYKAYFE